jgi:hypothetical protein
MVSHLTDHNDITVIFLSSIAHKNHLEEKVLPVVRAALKTELKLGYAPPTLGAEFYQQ